MEVIDILIKIANDEYVPYRIKVNGDIYHYVYDDKMYVRDDGDKDEFYTDEMLTGFVSLNDKVEIIEDSTDMVWSS